MIGRSSSNDRDFFDEPGWGTTSLCHDGDYGVDSTHYFVDSGSFVGAGAINVTSSSSLGSETMNDLQLLDVHESID